MSNTSGLKLCHAATIAGLAYLLNPVSYAEFVLFPHLIIPSDIAQTVQNIRAHPHQFLGGSFCYLASFTGDIVLAWSLYLLLSPVNKAVSLLASWFQLIYAALALTGAVNLITVHQMITRPELASALGAALNGQVMLLLGAFRSYWNLSLVLFGSHLVLIGTLIYRSTYIPKVLGILLVLNGLGWVVASLGPYAFPDTGFGLVSITFFGELLFMAWLLIRGWKIPEMQT